MNPYNTPATVSVMRRIDGVEREQLFFTGDIQSAYYLARDMAVKEYNMPFDRFINNFGELEGWEYIQFTKVKHTIEQLPEDDYEIFYRDFGEGDYVSYVIYYTREDEDDEMEGLEEGEEELIRAAHWFIHYTQKLYLRLQHK